MTDVRSDVPPRWKTRRLIGPAIMTAAMLVVLTGLGTWQVRRLEWKQALLAEIARSEATAAIPLPRNPDPYAKVSLSGTLLSNQTALYGAEVRTTPAGPVMGGRMIVPLRQSDGRIILVDRGWAPEVRTAPLAQPTGIVTFTGYVRPGSKPGWFSAKDNPATRRFFTLDPNTIGDALGQPDVAPFILVVLADRAEPRASYPEPAQTPPRPPNNHLAYAVTWYGLAVALMVIFTVWVKKGSHT